MSFLEKTRTWTDILKNVAIIAIIVFVAVMAGLSVWANVVENRVDTGPKPPDVKTARYEFLIVNTGQMIYADAYEIAGDGVYKLDRFYVDKNGRYKLMKAPLTLDESVFGGIIITDRAKEGE